jgi:hypothetical protein
MTSFAHTPPVHTLSAEDDWFAALDHQMVDVGGRTWVIEVVGIHDTAGALWLQVQRADSAEITTVVRMERTFTPGQALQAIAARFAELVRGDVPSAPVSLTRV